MQVVGVLQQKRHGYMMLGIDFERRTHCVIKATSAQYITEREQTGLRALNEKQMLEALSEAPSPFVVSFAYAHSDPNFFYLGMTYVGGGDLLGRLMPDPAADDEALVTLHEDEVKLYMAQMVLAIDHLHRNLVMHRNVKPENILIDMNGFVKLSGFGMAKQLAARRAARDGTLCGSPEYVAPEVLLGRAYDESVDYWSLGCVAYELLAGQTPFAARGDSVRQTVANVIDGAYSCPPSFSEEAHGLVEGLLRPPQSRIDRESVQAHPFFAHLDWDAVAQQTVEPLWRPGSAAGLASAAAPVASEELDEQTEELTWETFESLALHYPPMAGQHFPSPPTHFFSEGGETYSSLVCPARSQPLSAGAFASPATVMAREPAREPVYHYGAPPAPPAPRVRPNPNATVASGWSESR